MDKAIYTRYTKILNMPESDENAIFTATVTKLGRVTIPESVRALLDIKNDDIVEINIRKKKPVAKT